MLHKQSKAENQAKGNRTTGGMALITGMSAGVAHVWNLAPPLINYVTMSMFLLHASVFSEYSIA